MCNSLNNLDCKVLIVKEDKLLCYKKGKVWVDYNGSIKKCFVRKGLLCKFRLFERLFRLEPRLGFDLDDVMYFSMKNVLYRIDENLGLVTKAFIFRKGMNNPLSICKVILDQKENVFFGDYWPNKKRDECRIYRFDGEQVIVVNSMKGIKHIHSIEYDSFRECFYILTGDSDSESGIYIANKDFSSINPLFLNSKKYRSCAIIPTMDGLIYATDNPSAPNWLKHISFKNNGFLEPVDVMRMPGPCIFGGCYRSKIFFSTSVEPNPEQNIIKYWLSNKYGAGNVNNCSYVFSYEDGRIKELLCLVKDSFNMAFFGFGNNQIMGIRGNRLFVYCSAVKKYDGKTVLIDLKEGEEQ